VARAQFCGAHRRALWNKGVAFWCHQPEFGRRVAQAPEHPGDL